MLYWPLVYVANRTCIPNGPLEEMGEPECIAEKHIFTPFATQCSLRFSCFPPVPGRGFNVWHFPSFYGQSPFFGTVSFYGFYNLNQLLHYGTSLCRVCCSSTFVHVFWCCEIMWPFVECFCPAPQDLLDLSFNPPNQEPLNMGQHRVHIERSPSEGLPTKTLWNMNCTHNTCSLCVGIMCVAKLWIQYSSCHDKTPHVFFWSSGCEQFAQRRVVKLLCDVVTSEQCISGANPPATVLLLLQRFPGSIFS